ncbi:uncharacterized protein LOC123873092 isoform X2 [Maniola jurtina]|uniref:uncharacterized protein LOC123873092 isoform X2 n=1 Tax=Maniola jurtina TaxID=191418 RepID=UPI001E6897FB|nr:uncharacterized protein LOC123873092 isoform X2 [Maniola jurtina]
MVLCNQHQKQYTDHRISDMKLTRSASDQNVFFTYVCLVNEVKPSFASNGVSSTDRGLLRTSFHIIHENADEIIQEQPIQVERSKALHELVESHKHDRDVAGQETVQTKDKPVNENNESDTEDSNHYVNPKKLTLTKMKWLTEGRTDSPDSSSPYLTPDSSMTSIGSRKSEDMMDTHESFGDKCLSTILRLDREHNMFGLSNIAIVDKKVSKKIRKEDDKPVFPQNPIVQICCGRSCCKHKSNTDLPASLKCSGCRSCCIDPCCLICAGKCGTPSDPPCPSLCTQCPRGKCVCKESCLPSKCRIDCTTCYGMKITFKRKPKFDPSPNELTPRSSCILQKPMACRSCHHLPQCIPPSNCFPYLMPCYWPSRAGAPCNHPSRCFHNPPCRPPRKRASCIPPDEVCPTTGKCADEAKNTKCSNQACPGQNPVMKSAIEKRFGDKK